MIARVKREARRPLVESQNQHRALKGRNLNSDGRADLIVGAGPGAPGGHVKVFDGKTGGEVLSFFAFQPNFLGGVRVATSDVDSDKIPDIIVGSGPGAGPTCESLPCY